MVLWNKKAFKRVGYITGTLLMLWSPVATAQAELPPGHPPILMPGAETSGIIPTPDGLSDSQAGSAHTCCKTSRHQTPIVLGAFVLAAIALFFFWRKQKKIK